MGNIRRFRRTAQPMSKFLIQDITDSKEAPNRVGRENCYVCDKCLGHIVTVDSDPGVTPMFLGCRATEGCDGRMVSSGYPDPSKKPASIGPATWEWYRPDFTQHYDREMKDYIHRGGLELRRIRTEIE